MSQRRTLIKGAFILTAASIATRIMGFFYRIFLSRVFHAEGVGLYQLIFPVYALCFSLTSAGIEVVLSRIVARHLSVHQEESAVNALRSALLITVLLSLGNMLLLQRNADMIAVRLLNDSRLSSLLVIMGYALPFASIHSCVCGYHFGRKETKIPAASQLFEQLARILSVWLLYRFGLWRNTGLPITIAVVGLVCGEAFAAAYSVIALRKTFTAYPLRLPSILTSGVELLRLSAPLTANRILLNLLQSFEAISIPAKLQSSGLSLSEALGAYGILTGMALPCILFPQAVTNAVSTMLLPTVAEIQTTSGREKLRLLIQKVITSIFFLGLFCMCGFFVLGRWIGTTLFHNVQAGNFILTLSFICPFLYLNTTLVSIINGLGKTMCSFLINTAGLLLRIGSVFLLIPRFGILGYLRGLLLSQCAVTLLALFFLGNYLRREA